MTNAALAVGATVCSVTSQKKDVTSNKCKYSILNYTAPFLIYQIDFQIEVPFVEESFTPIIYLVLLQLFTYLNIAALLLLTYVYLLILIDTS